MRLIDADISIDSIRNLLGNGATLEQAIDAQATAYDVDKVAEQVKEKGTRICCSVKCTENCEDCEHGCLMRMILKTVRAGGVNE